MRTQTKKLKEYQRNSGAKGTIKIFTAGWISVTDLNRQSSLNSKRRKSREAHQDTLELAYPKQKTEYWKQEWKVILNKVIRVLIRNIGDQKVVEFDIYKLLKEKKNCPPKQSDKSPSEMKKKLKCYQTKTKGDRFNNTCPERSAKLQVEWEGTVDRNSKPYEEIRFLIKVYLDKYKS